MKIGLLGHGVVGGGVTEITDSCKVRKVRRLEVTKILVKDNVKGNGSPESAKLDNLVSLAFKTVPRGSSSNNSSEISTNAQNYKTILSKVSQAGKPAYSNIYVTTRTAFSSVPVDV